MTAVVRDVGDGGDDALPIPLSLCVTSLPPAEGATAVVGSSGNLAASSRDRGDTERAMQVYKWRWVVLAVMCFVNATNQMLWLSYAPVAGLASIFFNADSDHVNAFSLVFLVELVLLGLPTIWLIDAKGLKLSLIVGAWINAAGAAIRACSSLDVVPPEARFIVAMVGQTIASIAQGIPMFGITKLAELWFPDGQRAIASSIASMSNPLGVLLAYVIVPVLATTPDDIKKVTVVMGCPALATAIFASAAVRSSKPPTPPTVGSRDDQQSFVAGLKQISKNPQLWILFFALGGGFGLFTALFTLLQQELCASGYDDQFSGICGILMIVCGIVGAILFGIVLEKTKAFEELVKVLYACCYLSFVFYCIISRYPNQNALVALSVSMFGFFGLAAYPALLELAVEVTYPVAEVISCGLLTLSGGLHGIIYLVMAQVLSTPLAASGGRRSVCQADSSDFTYSTMFLECAAAVAGLVLIIFLRPVYRRLDAETAIRLRQRPPAVDAKPNERTPPVSETAGEASSITEVKPPPDVLSDVDIGCDGARTMIKPSAASSEIGSGCDDARENRNDSTVL